MTPADVHATSQRLFMDIGPGRIGAMTLLVARTSLDGGQPLRIPSEILQLATSRIVMAEQVLQRDIDDRLQSIGATMSRELQAHRANALEAVAHIASRVAMPNFDVEELKERLRLIPNMDEVCVARIEPDVTRFLKDLSSDLAHYADQLNEGDRLRVARAVDEVGKIGMRIRMVAVNASVEAARAGDAGRGFGVIAGETKSLAQSMSSVLGDISKYLRQV